MSATPDDAPNLSERHEYTRQLGLFALMFSQTEKYLFICLMLTSGVSLDVGRAIFSGTRVAEAIGHMKRIFLVKQFTQDIKSTLEACFEQVEKINAMRNHLFHHGIDFTGEGLKSTNSARAFLKEREISYYVSDKLLADMTSDLHQINQTLSYCSSVLNRRDPGRVPEAAVKAGQRSWLYKPPERETKESTTLGSTRRQKRRPQPSSE